MIHHVTKFVQHTSAAMEGFSQGSAIGKLLIGFGSAVVGFFSPIIYLILICFATTITDMVYGIKVAIKKNKKLESNKTWKGTLGKLKAELVLLAITHGLEWAVLDQSGIFVLTGGMTVIITLTELWSILENLNTLDPEGPWKSLGKFLKEKGEDYTGIDIDLKDKHDDDANVVKEPLEDSH